MCASLSYGQVKVVSNGWTKIGNTTSAPATQLHVQSTDLFVGTIDGSGPTSRLKINHSGSNAGVLFATGNVNRYSTAAYQAGSGLIDFTFYNDQNATAALLIDGDTNNANFAGTVSSMGNLLTSDKRQKRNIKKVENGLEKVLKINPVKFQYKNSKINPNVSDRQFVGVLAQELQKIDPSLVSTYTHYEVDEDLIPTGATEEILQIQADAVQYLLVDAIKAQQVLIEDQSVRIAELEEAIKLVSSNDPETNSTNIKLSSYDLARIGQNIPNPYTNITKINYVIPSDATESNLNIFDSTGRLVKSESIDHVGEGVLTIDASDLNSGIYSYQLVVNGRSIQSHKMVVQ